MERELDERGGAEGHEEQEEVLEAEGADGVGRKSREEGTGGGMESRWRGGPLPSSVPLFPELLEDGGRRDEGRRTKREGSWRLLGGSLETYWELVCSLLEASWGRLGGF